MKAKEKAIELVDKMGVFQYPSELEKDLSKNSAHMVADEVIEMINDPDLLAFWLEVKNEIYLL